MNKLQIFSGKIKTQLSLLILTIIFPVKSSHIEQHENILLEILNEVEKMFT